MRRSLLSVQLTLDRVRCGCGLRTSASSLVLARPATPPFHTLRAMSTMSEPAGSTTATASNKRSAGRQQGGGAWKKRQRWQGRGEGRWDRHDRSRPGAEQEAKEERKSDSGEAAGAESGEAGERRLPKRKVALVFGYNGSGFAGLQIQSGSDAPTIEAAVADAILAAGGMLESNRQQLTKLGWQRCARTDKGVSAATNVLSLNLITQPDGILERINAHLPAAIRCFAWMRVMGAFHAKYSCTSRVYNYILPAYAFDASISQHISAQRARERGAREEVRKQNGDRDRAAGAPSSNHTRRKGESDSEQSEAEEEAEEAEDDFDSDRDNIAISDELRAQLLAYRISDELRERVHALLGRFSGTHNYYNLTRHKRVYNREDRPSHSADANAAATHSSEPNNAQPAAAAGPVTPGHLSFDAKRNTRYVLSFGVERAFVDPGSGLQLLVLAVHGQSFMLNQIRKMVGLAVVAARGMVGDGVWARVFKESGLYVPTAPALGLCLDRPNFTLYDAKCKKQQQQQGEEGQAGAEGEGSERPAVAQVYEQHEAEIEQFRQSVIYPTICSAEAEQLAFYRWLAGLGLHPSLSQQDSAQQRSGAASVAVEVGSQSATELSSSGAEQISESVEQQAVASCAEMLPEQDAD